jgi:hypothetical protein
MRRFIFTLCAATAAVTGCAPAGPDPVVVSAEVAKVEAEWAAKDAERQSQMAEGRRKIRACQDAMARLKIGAGADAVVATLPPGPHCRPDRINRTETAAGFRDQWVYSEYHNDFSSYLYFTNGVLVAKQT